MVNNEANAVLPLPEQLLELKNAVPREPQKLNVDSMLLFQKPVGYQTPPEHVVPTMVTEDPLNDFWLK